tara:strand:- start:487 stop:774 length:288 start_codon:yes stop_codon:yes gene_type:complete
MKFNSILLVLPLLFIIEIKINNLKTIAEEKENDLITKICLLSFEAEMESSGKIPPPEMAGFTCDCFLNNIGEGISIKEAQIDCKNKANEKFKLDI